MDAFRPLPALVRSLGIASLTGPSLSRRALRPLAALLFCAACVLGTSGCSIRTYALKATADALSGTGGGYGTEEDPELVRDAAPFGLKTMETLAEALPEHRPIRLSLASGFAQYSYAFINQDADRAEDKNLALAKALGTRARRLYLRARGYALRGLDIRYPGASAALLGADRAAWKATLDKMDAEDVPYLYWCGASWALALSTAKDDANLIGDIAVIDAIMTRALALNESYDEGALHEFYVSFAGALGDGSGGGPKRAKEELDRALKLGDGKKLGVLVSYAEGILVAQQKKAEFQQMLKRVTDADVYAEEPAWKKQRLANILAQSRAKWLLGKLSDLFAE